jgi:hypothetical protein
MPLFEVDVRRTVTERADVEVEADTPEAAQQLVEADIENHSVDVEWWRCDCQDDGSVWVVTEIKAEVAAGWACRTHRRKLSRPLCDASSVFPANAMTAGRLGNSY